MRMIQITESKQMKLADYTEKILHYAGKMMQCVEALEEESEGGMGQRGGYGERADDYPMEDFVGMRGSGPVGMRNKVNMRGEYDNNLDEGEMGQRGGMGYRRGRGGR